MKMVRILALLLIVILVGGAVSGAEVWSINCGTEVVKLGDSQNDVLEKCRDPSYTVGNAWVYDMGFSQPLKVIHSGGADIFRPIAIKMEEIEQSGSGDEPRKGSRMPGDFVDVREEPGLVPLRRFPYKDGNGTTKGGRTDAKAKPF